MAAQSLLGLIVLTALWALSHALAVSGAAAAATGSAEPASSCGTAPWMPELLRPIPCLAEALGRWIRVSYANPALYLSLPLLWVLEAVIPANPAQRLVGKGLLQDMLWFVLGVPGNLFLLSVIAGWLDTLYRAHLSLLSFHFAESWPMAARVVTAFLLMELVFWLSHYARHKVPLLWLFHSVHHSQTELNAFSDTRVHMGDKISHLLFQFLPFSLFGVPAMLTAAIAGIYMQVHSYFVHANVRMNLGYFGYIFSSPQFRRLHHSAVPEHFDRNFGGILSIYDHLFGTAWKCVHVYPPTGIHDRTFPLEDRRDLQALLVSWFRQNLHPFVRMMPQVRRRLRSPG